MHLVILSCLLAAAVFVPAASAADPAAGKKKAAACAVCHGLDGLSRIPDAPNLAGDSATYIVSQLKAFQAGTRQNEQMSIMAEGLSDDDIANLAAWYSSIKVKVELPQ
ncbi:MAG: cytochrome c [Geminicoccaceae bacterium]